MGNDSFSYTNDDEVYGLSPAERRIRARQLEARRKKRRKKKIKKYVRFFTAWLVVLTLAVLLVIGVVKLFGALFKSGDGSSAEQTADVTQTEPDDAANVPRKAGSSEILSHGKSVDPKVYEYAIPGEKGLIVVDAGHGGYDGGADNAGVFEKDINLDIACWVREELELRGYSVVMTRTDDSFIGLSKRAQIANDQKDALCFVSVHQNSIEGYDYIKGVEAWTHSREGCSELAEALAAGVSEMTEAENRGVSFRQALVVCRDTKMPAAIIECGYLSNPDELELLQQTDYQVNVARGIANGIDAFLGNSAGQ